MGQPTLGQKPGRRGISMRRWVLIGAVAALVAVPLATNPAGADSNAQLGGVCSTSFDPYAASDATLDACGIQSFPLEVRTALPDGGSSYHYTVFGHDTWVNTPPAGFQAAAADAATLSLYGIPPDPGPADAAAQTDWMTMAKSMKFVTPPPQLRSASVQFATSLNWSGQVGKKNGYTSVQARYTEPVHTSTCTGGMAGYWAGLGGFLQHALAQNGTAQNAPGIGMDQAWWEVLDDAAVPVPLFASPGFDFEAFTTRTSNGFIFFWWNSHTDESLSVSTTNSHYSGTTAEFIAERLKPGGVFKPLYKFGTIHVTLTANNVKVGDPNTDQVLVNAAGNVLAQPGSFDLGGTHFDDVWKRCS